MAKKALILVDLQNDFMPGGALEVKEGDKILPSVNELLNHSFDLIIASKDWHPRDHGSFAAVHGKKPGEHIKLHGLDQILWPVHCVQDSKGAEFSPGWETSKIQKVFYKGTDKNVDSYSAFFDNGHQNPTGLDAFLKENKITDIYVAGLTTEYCVKYSVIDASKMGFNIYVVEDACRGVNLKPNDIKDAIDEMRQVGAHIVKCKDIIGK